MGRTNADDLDWRTLEHGHTRFRRKQLGEAVDATEIGCSMYELSPGDRSWPYHYHTGNAEAIFVLDGRGSLRLDGTTVEIAAGTYVNLEPGPAGAHRVFNDGEDTLRYLVISTMNDPDVIVYPDSEKVGVFAGSPPGGRGDRWEHGYYRRADAVEYWDGEE